MKNKKLEQTYGASIALGIGIGTALGVAMGNIAIGVALGAGLGGAFFAIQAGKNKKGDTDSGS